jgi:hypothetical protein
MGCCSSTTDPIYVNVNYEADKKYIATVTKVYDGDTITANIIVGTIKVENKMIQICHEDSIRLNGIDAPEIRCLKNNPLRVKEKKAACKVRDILSSFLSKNKDSIILQICKEKDKYGRMLCDVFVENKMMNSSLSSNTLSSNTLSSNNISQNKCKEETDLKSCDINISKLLLSKKLVHEYKGKKKIPFTEKELDYIIEYRESLPL